MKSCYCISATEVAASERRRIRRAIAPSLKELAAQAKETCCICRLQLMVDRRPPCATCRASAALKAIDRATKATKRKATKGGTTP